MVLLMRSQTYYMFGQYITAQLGWKNGLVLLFLLHLLKGIKMPQLIHTHHEF